MSPEKGNYMDLEKILIDQNTLQVPGFSALDPFNSGNITMTGNGYLGFRGAFPDWGADKYAACTVTDTFDLADGKWKELCNVPNGLFWKAEIDGNAMEIESDQCLDFSHTLNFTYGLTAGEAVWKTSSDRKVELRWERFASYADLHLVPQKISLLAHSDCQVAIQTGIDGNIWSLNGNHFSRSDFDCDGDNLVFRGLTTEKKLPVLVGHRLVSNNLSLSDMNSPDGIYSSGSINLKKGDEIVFYIYMSVYSGNDTDDPYRDLLDSLEKAANKGYEDLKEEHFCRWDSMWDSTRIKIGGDETADRLLRYNMYHNFISTPAHSDSHPIGARGLSCQAYQGAAFWDQEIYNLPMFLYTRPEVAKQILIYRYKTLEGAKRKAERLGYAGAFYAWISGDTGDELCPDYFFKDVLSGRKIRNHFNDWQIHISPDISYTVIKYFGLTGDYDFICRYGAEMLLEIALFLYSRVHYNPHRDRYEVLRVLGPDEYHENADNNAFTNTQVRYALIKTIEILELIKGKDGSLAAELQKKTGVDDRILDKMKEIAKKIFIPAPVEESGLIEQFDGYFQLEDITPGLLKERLQDEQEYWGWPNGIAYETQVTKQADVVQMFVLHDYPVDIMRANYLYYEPRTQHRSSLSPGVHAIIAAQVGLNDQAYDYFMRSCSVDIANTHPPTSGGTFIGGIHTAACGISWQIAVLGFAGMKSGDSLLSFDPNLPEKWDFLEFSLYYRQTLLKVKIDRSIVKIVSSGPPSSPFTIRCGHEEKLIDKEGEISFG